MAENHEETKEAVDEQLEKARKSMGDRIDPDDAPLPEEKPKEEPKKQDVTPESKPAEEAPATEEKPKEESKPDVTPTDAPIKKVRPEAYIPLKKFHDFQREIGEKLQTAETRAKEAEAKVAELTTIAGQSDGAKKDEDIEAFMEQTGFDRETVEGFLKLAEKRLLSPERVQALELAGEIASETQMEAEFDNEFKTVAEPDLKKQFPDITPEQLAKVKPFLDAVAHTKDFHDKSLDFVIYKNLEEIKSLLGGDSQDDTKQDDAPPPQTKKTIESGRIGGGKPTRVSAKDFEGQNDFSSLNEMDQSERSALIKGFSPKTYENFKQWVRAQEPGVEVTRGGKKLILK